MITEQECIALAKSHSIHTKKQKPSSGIVKSADVLLPVLRSFDLTRQSTILISKTGYLVQAYEIEALGSGLAAVSQSRATVELNSDGKSLKGHINWEC